jgi:nitrogen fixation NifU-like protein
MVDFKTENVAQRIGYTKKLMQYFLNPKNAGPMEDATVTSLTGSVACGDMIKLYLKIEDDVIKRATFESYGCAANIATASVMTEMVTGMRVEEARKITFRDVVEELGGVPRIKYHCATLAVQSLQIALDKYEVLAGRKPLDKNFVLRLLRGILDPETDKDLVSAGKVKDVKVDGRRVEITLAMADGGEAAKVVREDVTQVFEGLNVELVLLFSPPE